MNAKIKNANVLNKAKSKKIKSFLDEYGVVNCSFSKNNTIMNFSRPNGDVIFWWTPGRLGYKNTKKSSPYVAKKVAEAVINEIIVYGIKNIKIKVRKIGPGRDMVMKEFLKNDSFNILELIDDTPIRLGGGVLPKKRPRK